LSYFLLTRLARLLTRVVLGLKFHLRGREHVPPVGALLIVSNHVGAVDPALIGGWAPRPVWFMAKAELFEGRWAWLMRGYHAFPVIRHSADRSALRRAFDVLKQGKALVLFPEGHRSEDAGLLRAEPGAGFIARRSGATLHGAGDHGHREGPAAPQAVTKTGRGLDGIRAAVHPTGAKRRRKQDGPPAKCRLPDDKDCGTPTV